MTLDRPQAENDITLAIECAVGLGSIAVLANGSVVASTSGQICNPSRAEEVLQIIDQVLEQADGSISDVDGIVVSAGPGSYSGIRIGLATALGLKHSLGIGCTTIPLLEAMAGSSGADSTQIAAVPVGKKDIAWQVFGVGNVAVTEPELADETAFLAQLSVSLPETVLVHTDLVRLVDQLPEGIRLIDGGDCLAQYLGTYASRFPAIGWTGPLYLRNRSHTGKILS